jgi:ferritin-like metal-binding protein YciE
MKEKATRRRKNAAPPTIEEQRAQFIELLMNRYWAEKELVTLLPELRKQATSYELITAINSHLETSQRQVIRLIHIFDSLEERAIGYKCEDMATLLIDVSHLASRFTTGFPRDNAIILHCQKIMAYEIASYKLLKGLAAVLGEELTETYLSVAIDEEKAAHALLTEIALHSIYFDEAG